MEKLLVFAVVVGLSTVVMATGDACTGKMKAAACAGCYGMNGIAMVPSYPSLASQNTAYFEGAQKACKLKDRKEYQAPFMHSMAARLYDEDMADIIAFYANQK